MRKTILFLFSVFLFLSVESAKQTATFAFASTRENTPMVKEYNSLKISVNNVAIAKQDKPYTVKLLSLLDTIKIENHPYDKNMFLVLTKLKAGEKYSLTFSVCSFMEIRPENDTLERTMLVRVIMTNKDDKPLFFQGSFCCSELVDLSKSDTTAYYKNMFSGLCPFAVSSFYMCNSEEDLNEAEDTSKCSHVIIHYFSNEMFSILYDCKTKQMNVKFDSYYDKTKPIIIKGD